MTLVESFKNGLWVHSPAPLGIAPDVNFYRVAAGRYALSDLNATYLAANRGVEIGVGAIPADFTSAAAGLTVTMRTQSAGGVGPANGGDLVMLTGNPTGAGRRGYVNVTGAGAGIQTTMIGQEAGGFSIGADCTFIGFSAGRDATAATGCTFVGSQAGINATGANNTAVGYGALIEAARTTSIAIGAAAACAGGNLNTVVAYNSTATGTGNVLIGPNALVTGSNNVAIGASTNVAVSDSVAIGVQTSTAAASIVLGRGATTSTANTAVLGSNGYPINILYGGKGELNAAPTAWAVSGTGGTLVNGQPGADLLLTGGPGTGTGLGGSVIIETALAGLAGIVWNPQIPRITVAQDGGTTWTGITTVMSPAVSPANSGTIFYDRTLQQFMASQNGGAYVPVITPGSVPGAPLTSFQWNSGGAFAGTADLEYIIGDSAVQLCTGTRFKGGGAPAAWAAGAGSGGAVYGRTQDAFATGGGTGGNFTFQTGVGDLAGIGGTMTFLLGDGGATPGTRRGYFNVCGSAVSASRVTAIGTDAGTLGAGTDCVFIGHRAGYNCTVQTDGVFVGAFAGGFGSNPGNYCTLIGSNATVRNAGDNAVVAVGYTATADAGAVGIGYAASARDAYSIAIGNNAVANNGSIGLGHLVNVIHASCVVFGDSATTTAGNQFVAGSSGSSIDNVYFGKGVRDAAPTAYTINGTSGTGNNIAGGALRLAGGIGTGSGNGGDLIFRVAPRDTGGGAALPNTLTTVGTVNQFGNHSWTQLASAVAGATPVMLTFTGAANTGVADAECSDVYLNLARTVTFTGGAGFPLQRAVNIAAPTYSTTQVIVTAATLYVNAAPALVGGGSITQSYGIYQAAGNAYFGGALNLNSSAAAVSPAGEGRIRYNNGTSAFEVSISGGAYVALSTGTSPVGANPTGTVGLATVNGVLTTFMRSDAAPPLSQAIAPTWTAVHNWSTAGVVMFAVPQLAGTFTGTGCTVAGVGAGAAMAVGCNNNTIYGNAAGDGITTGTGNTCIGKDAGGAAASAGMSDATMVGNGAGILNTASQVTFVGSGAGAANTSGVRNTALGYRALNANQTANDITAVGYQALLLATAGPNTAIGSGALDAVTSGTNNTAIGLNAGGTQSTQNDGTFLGSNAGAANATAFSTFIGSGAGAANTSGASNTALGYQALTACTTSFGCTAIGYRALATIVNVSQSTTAVGAQAGEVFTGNYGTFIGWQAGVVATGSDNTFLGGRAGQTVTTGTSNVIIGANAQQTAAANANAVIIGAAATGGPNCVTVGQNSPNQGTSCILVGQGSSIGAVGTATLIVGAGSTGVSGAIQIGNAAGALNAGGTDICIGRGSRASGVTVGTGSGNNQSASGANVIVGSASGNAITTSSNNVVVGQSAATALNNLGGGNIIVGAAAGPTPVSNLRCLIIGARADAETTANSSIAIGCNSGAVAGANALHTGVILLGCGDGVGVGPVSTASNQFVAGCEVIPMTSVYFGKGVTSVAPTAYTINGTGGSGNNIAGGDMALAGGINTGSGNPGNLILRFSLADGAAAVLGTRVDALMIRGRVSPAAFAAAAADGMDVWMRSQDAFATGGGRGGNLYWRAGAGDGAGVPSKFILQGQAGTDVVVFNQIPGLVTVTQPVRTSGTATMMILNGGAHTTLTAGTESSDVIFNLNRTVQFATGAHALQRAFYIVPPTYAFVGASTLTEAASFAITSAPLQGANATITKSWALTVNSGGHTVGAPGIAKFSATASTGLTASTEINDVLFDLSASRTWATGNIGFQAAFRIKPPTYLITAGVGQTFTDVATMYIDSAPINGGGGTVFTNSYSLWVNTGKALFGDVLATRTSVNVETANTAACVLQSISEEVTILNAATTDSATNLLPANSFIVGVTARVTVVLPGAVTWQAGTTGSTSLFMAAGTSGAAGTQATSYAHTVASLAPFINQAAAVIRITPSGLPGAATGKIRFTVFYYTLTAPGS